MKQESSTSMKRARRSRPSNPQDEPSFTIIEEFEHQKKEGNFGGQSHKRGKCGQRATCNSEFLFGIEVDLGTRALPMESTLRILH